MAKKEINLLPTDVKEQRKSEKLKTSLGNLSIIALVVIGAVSLVSFLLVLNLKISEANFKKESQRAQEKIKDLGVVEAEASRLSSKVTGISKMLTEKNKYSVLLSSISKASPETITVTSLSSFGDNRVSLSGAVPSYLVLSRFVTSLLDPGLGGKIFANLDLTAASLDEVTGKIRFSMVLYLKDNVLK